MSTLLKPVQHKTVLQQSVQKTYFSAYQQPYSISHQFPYIFQIIFFFFMSRCPACLVFTQVIIYQRRLWALQLFSLQEAAYHPPNCMIYKSGRSFGADMQGMLSCRERRWGLSLLLMPCPSTSPWHNLCERRPQQESQVATYFIYLFIFTYKEE